MDTVQWPQEIMVKPIEEMVTNTSSKSSMERTSRPQKEQIINCPRCNSTNTKFCYYNNYSLTQPRYFCKTCRRYWTEGGSLRNIPVGGGSRKNKRPSSSSTPTSSSSSKKLPDLITSQNHHHQNPKIQEGQDLNLAFSVPPQQQDYRTISDLVSVPSGMENSSTNKNHQQLSALELLSGFTSRGFNSFMPMPIPDQNSVFPSGFSLQEYKPTLNFSLDGIGNGYANLEGVHQESNGRLLFPFEDLKQISSSNNMEQNREHGGDSTGYWTGILGGGSW